MCGLFGKLEKGSRLHCRRGLVAPEDPIKENKVDLKATIKQPCSMPNC
jgi:hypothetical protein